MHGKIKILRLTLVLHIQIVHIVNGPEKASFCDSTSNYGWTGLLY